MALLEVGASAGLNLYPDKYTYRYNIYRCNGHRLGDGGPVLEYDAPGLPAPAGLPRVVWRAGLDLNPLDVTDPGDVAWLEALVWPEHSHRLARLRAAVAIAAEQPPTLFRGDLVADLPRLAAQAPAGATLVVFHSAVLYQVPTEQRERFVELVRTLPGHWVCVEAPDVVPYEGLPPSPYDMAHYAVALDGKPLAWARPHGQAMVWFG